MIIITLVLSLLLFSGIVLAQESTVITSVLEYKSGTDWDIDNDGIELPPDGVIDFTIENTQFAETLNHSKLCTKWEVESQDTGSKEYECYGAESCCNFLNLDSTLATWKAPFPLFFSRMSSTEANLVSAQVIYVDLSSLDNIRVEYSEKESLPAYFINPDTIVISISTDKDEYVLGEQVSFEVEGPDYLDYTITIQKDEEEFQLLGGSNVFAPQEDGTYTVVVEGAAGNIVKTATTSFVVQPSVGTFVYTDKQIYAFGEPVEITVDIANYEKLEVSMDIDNDLFKLFETDKRDHIFVPSGPGRYAVTGYGYISGEYTSQTVYFDVIMDTELRARIYIENPLMQEIQAAITCFEADTGKEISNNNNRFTLNYGTKYNLIVEPMNGPVTKLEINELVLYEDKNFTLNLDPAIPLYGTLSEEWDQMYAIDLSEFNMTNATMTIAPAGNTVYKCAAWDFDIRTCEGEWTRLKQSTGPYTLTLTPGDPGFAEKTEELTIPAATFGTFGTALDDNLTVYREQPDGIGTNRTVDVDFVFANNGNTEIKNITLFETVADGWTALDPSLIVNNTLVANIGNIAAGTHTIFSYKLVAPSAEGASIFNNSYVNYVEQNTTYTRNIPATTIRINDSKAFFNAKAEFTGNDSRTAQDTATIKFNVTNIGNSGVTKYETFFYWKYDPNLIYAEEKDILGDCNQKAVIDFEGMKAIKCTWP
ncbi:hypothetical protein KY335_04365, partial [Candidatus Woesearchaeota archaeon]|nr:hypothetical protein [Candidatus Woesearchaeota archaeon]